MLTEVCEHKVGNGVRIVVRVLCGPMRIGFDEPTLHTPGIAPRLAVNGRYPFDGAPVKLTIAGQSPRRIVAVYIFPWCNGHIPGVNAGQLPAALWGEGREPRCLTEGLRSIVEQAGRGHARTASPSARICRLEDGWFEAMKA